MADLATDLLRMTARAFYSTDHILVIDALIRHSTLPDFDLAHVLGMQVKYLRKVCGKLKEDGLLSVHSRGERRADGSGGFYGSGAQQGKERVVHRDWFYLNYHRAIDSLKFRLHKLNKFVESQGSSVTEKKDWVCNQCGNKWTDLEAMDRIDMETGNFLCNRCGAILVPSDETEQSNDNESMKRLNQEISKLLSLMQQIDSTDVPENDFEMALSKQKPIERSQDHPAGRTEVVDLPNGNLQSTKGLDIKPEKIAVQVQDDEDVKRENAASEAAAKREKEARQNALPDWISKSTVSGEITAVGAKEERLRLEREAHAAVVKDDDGEEKKPVADNEDVMAAYWEEYARAQEKEAAEARAAEEEEEDDDEDDDDVDFEDIDITGGNNTPALSSGGNVDSSNANDDERDSKRVKLNGSQPGAVVSSFALANGESAADTPAASDEDEEDLEFEEV